MSKQVARQSVGTGGLALPHLTHELQALGVAVAQRWSRPVCAVSSSIGGILLQGAHLRDGIMSPSRLPATTPTLQPSLAATGLQLRHALTVRPRDAGEVQLGVAAMRHFGRGTSSEYVREAGWLSIDYSRHHGVLAPLRDLQAAQFGNLHSAALLQCHVFGDGVLLDATGVPLGPKAFLGIATAGDRFRDVLDVAWSAHGTIMFRPVRVPFPLPPVAALSFRWLCDCLVLLYPAILRPPAQPEDLITRPPSLDVWRLTHDGTRFSFTWNPATDAAVPLGYVTSTAESTAAARRVLQDPSGRFDLHHWLDQPFAL